MQGLYTPLFSFRQIRPRRFTAEIRTGNLFETAANHRAWKFKDTSDERTDRWTNELTNEWSNKRTNEELSGRRTKRSNEFSFWLPPTSLVHSSARSVVGGKDGGYGFANGHCHCGECHCHSAPTIPAAKHMDANFPDAHLLWVLELVPPKNASLIEELPRSIVLAPSTPFVRSTNKVHTAHSPSLSILVSISV